MYNLLSSPEDWKYDHGRWRFAVSRHRDPFGYRGCHDNHVRNAGSAPLRFRLVARWMEARGCVRWRLFHSSGCAAASFGPTTRAHLGDKPLEAARIRVKGSPAHKGEGCAASRNVSSTPFDATKGVIHGAPPTVKAERNAPSLNHPTLSYQCESGICLMKSAIRLRCQRLQSNREDCRATPPHPRVRLDEQPVPL